MLNLKLDKYLFYSLQIGSVVDILKRKNVRQMRQKPTKMSCYYINKGIILFIIIFILYY